MKFHTDFFEHICIYIARLAPTFNQYHYTHLCRVSSQCQLRSERVATGRQSPRRMCLMSALQGKQRTQHYLLIKYNPQSLIISINLADFSITVGCVRYTYIHTYICTSRADRRPPLKIARSCSHSLALCSALLLLLLCSLSSPSSNNTC